MLIVFDFDGTLAPIVPDRTKAELPNENRIFLHDLAAMEKTAVAVISSRHLDDLLCRIDVPEVFVGGSSGLEWFIPGKGRSEISQQYKDEIYHARLHYMDVIRSLTRLKGIEIEDKFWSIAIHTRNASESSKKHLDSLLQDWTPLRRLRKFRGPNAVEVALISAIDKTSGLKRLCDLIGFDPKPAGLIYAGDDENDSQAMSWVLYMGGVVITVGSQRLLPESHLVSNPLCLASEFRNILTQLQHC